MSFTIRKPDVRLTANRFAGTTKEMTKKQLPYPIPYNPVNNDPDVVANFLFESGSGNITSIQDGSIALTAFGTPTYGIMEEGAYQKISPGIRYDGTAEHQKLTGFSQLDLVSTTEKFVVEWWMKTTDSIGSTKHLWAYQVGSATTHGIQCRMTSPTNMEILLSSDLSNTATASFTTMAFNDGTPRLFRLLIDLEGESFLKINTRLQGSPQDTSALAGETFTNAGLRIAGAFDGVSSRLACTYYSWRFAKTTTPWLVNLAGPERP